jgi:hypothetical protein
MLKQRIAIILVNWNQYDDTAECLRSLLQITYQDRQIIVVDNGSVDDSAGRLAHDFPNIELIRNERNLGFAGGNNVGIAAALRAGADAGLLLHNDTTVAPDFLDQLVKVAWDDPQVGAVGPKIYYYSKPEVIWFAGGYISRWTGRTYHPAINQLDCGQFDQMQEVDFLTGCAILVKREVIEKVGSLDIDYFNNFEDVDWSLRMRRLGYKLLYVPGSKIWHKWSVSFGGRFSPFYTYYKTRNSLLYLKKNKMPLINFLYAYSVFPVKMLFYTLMSGKLINVLAVLVALKDYLSGKYGEGTVFRKK